MDTLTIVHVVLSLLTIVVGFVVIVGMVLRLQTDRWAGPFLLGTAATSITGFLFPFHGFTPAIGLGIIYPPVPRLSRMTGMIPTRLRSDNPGEFPGGRADRRSQRPPVRCGNGPCRRA